MSEQTETFGVHLMVDGYDADPARLADLGALEEMLHEIPAQLGMHTISEPLVVEVGPLNPRDPGGISGVVLIAESHIGFHTFPARGFVTIDVYTCQPDLDCDRVTALLKEKFLIGNMDVHLVKRGTRYPSEDIHPHQHEMSDVS
jgi:S-adenosylmethionine decarboxylase